MRKKSFLLFVILCCITILVACVFVACNPDNKNQGDIGEKIKFTLTFDVDGAAYAKIQTAGNEIIALPDNPVKDGYVFDGWYWDKNVWSQPFTVTSLANQPLASDMTVYAKWITEEESRIGVVNFVTNGGSVVSPIRTGILEISPVTVRSGYILEGWYTTATLDDDTKVSFPLQVSGDMCLYAKWNIVEYSIRYVTGGGRLPSETPYEYTIETQTVLPVPDREGYTFVGWYENEDFSGPQTAVITVGQIGEKTFYARWQINEYTITFDSMGGSEVDSVRGDFGTPVAAPVSPVQKGYDFVGWFTDRTYEEEFVFDNMPAESITLYAKWSAVEYDLIYHTFDGLMPDGAQYKYTIEDEFTLPIPSKDYYTFAGWFDNADLQGTPIVSINEGNTGNKELWAKWDATAYSIKYNLDGGINGNNPPSYNTEDETIVLATPRKTGYSFVGWYDNSKFEGEAVSEIASGSSGNKEFWAKWEINQYVISFETNGGSVIEDAEYDFGAQVVCPTAPVRAGYIFEGWYSSEDLSQTYTFGKMPAEDIKIYAKWSIEIYDIIYDADNADLPVEAVFTYTVEDEVPLPLIEKEGYTFEGWFDNEQFEGNSIEQIAAGTTGDLYLFAKFVINQYTITFDTDGGSEIAAVTQDFGTAIDAPEQPVKNGYTFGGWFIDETLSEELVFDTMPAQSITVYAKWVPIEYSIAYMVNGGVMPSDYITSYTVEDYIALPAPEKTGYTFIGWFETEELSGEASFEIFVGSTGDKTYFAGYIINQYTITFAVNGGSDIESVTQDYNSLIVEPSSPSRTGYRFEGWFADSECTTEFVFDRMPADNITVYAKWSTISYTITYHNVDDAENTNPTVYTVEDEIELLNPVKNGYTFDYWYLNGDVYDKISEIKSGTTGNLDIYASWIKADNGYAIVSAPDYAFVSDTELKTIVEQNVTELDFRGTFTVSPNAGWRVFTEENCSQPSELTLRTATNLQEGDNYYYILVENNSTYLSQVYTVNVYRKHLYTVNLYSKSGSIGQSFELVEGNSVTEEAIDASFDLVDVGYRLTGWYFDSDYTEEYAIGTSINKNQSVINLYPKYEPLTYQIKYELDGGINSESNPSQYNVEDGNITLEQPTKDGWTFDGWWLESTFENPIEIIEISAPRSYVVYAKWVPFVFEETENGELIVLSYNGEYENVSIPDSVYGKAVVGVGASAFANCTGLKSLTIPDSITTIGEQAFSGCGSLTLITIPDSVTSIGQGAFSGCSALEQITIPFVGAEAGKTSSDTYQYPFGYIFGTSSYTGGTEVTQYYYGSSTGNTTFATYYIPSSLRKVTVAGGNILYGAFYNCSMLTSITSPENVTSIGAYAFYNCSSLTLVTIGNGVTSIGKSAFSGCSALTSIYYAGDMPSWLGKTWHSNVMASGRMLYIDGNKVEGEITIPEGVSSIPSYAFAYQTGITSVTISDSVTSIGNSAFYGCYTLVEVYNKSQLNILAGSSGNGYVAYYAKNVCTNEDDAQLTTDENGFIFYYDGTVGYLVGYTGADGEIVLPDGFTAYDGTVVNSYGIYKYAFYNFSGLTSITIGNSVTSIGDYAFYGCIGLTEINWNAVSVGDFSSGSNVFYNAGTAGDGITVTFGDSVEKIPAYSFQSCNSLTSVTIGNSVTSIGDYAFYGCIGLTEINWNAVSVGDFSSGSNVFYNAGRAEDGITVTFGDSVRKIPAYAFYVNSSSYRPNIKSVTIGNGVTSIGDSAFEGCSGLTSVIIGDSVTNIDSSVFEDCIGLTTITIPDSVTSIGYEAFRGCSGLTSITIGNGVTSIGSYAFYNCSGLTEINWNAISVSDFSSGNNVFYNAGTAGDGITVTFGDGVEKIPAYAFYVNSSSYRPNIVSVTIGNSVTSIGSSAFYGCSGLTEINWNAVSVSDFSSGNNVFYNVGTAGNGINVTFGNSVQKIPAYAFYYCSGLTSVTIGNSVTSIGSSAFRGCSGLTSIYYAGDVADWCGISGLNNIMSSGRVLYIGGNKVEGAVTIPDGVTSIPSYAFAYLTGITSVTIPDSVTSIGSSAFNGCYALVEVYNKSSLDIKKGNSGYGYVAYYAKNVYTAQGGSQITTDENGLVFIFADGKGYLVDYVGTAYTLMLPESFTAYDGTTVNSYDIYKHAFSGCSGLTSVTIPDSVTSIGYEAFCGCTGLTSVIIGNGVKSIGSYAFYGCSSLTSVTIPERVTSIGDYAFYGCTGLTSVTIPDSVTSIGYEAFRGCTGLTSVIIGNGVKSIGSYAFYGCSSLTSVTIPERVTSIGDYAFYGCTGLTEINWNALSVSDFSSYNNVFYNAGTAGDGITVTFGDSVQKIPAYAFYVNSSSYRPNIKSVTIGNSVTSIGDYAFRDCSGLTSITIPDSVTSIGDRAFYGCTKLESVTMGDNVVSIGKEAFYNTVWYNNQENGVVYIGNIVYGYRGTMPKDTTIVIKEGTIGISPYAFSNCTGLVSITIPESVTSIGSSAFSGCSGLTSIYYTGDMTSWLGKTWQSNVMASGRTLYIEGSKVEGAITIPDGVSSIPSYAVAYQKGITSVTIPDSVTSIGERAFYNCSGLTSVTIGNGVTSIGSYAFYNCSGLTEINWNAVSVSDFSSNSNVFYNAGTAGDGITVTFGDSVEKIPAYLFYVSNSSYRPNIKSVTIGNGVTSIRGSAFYNCTGLIEINWNAVSVSDFSSGNNVFYNAGTAGDGITVTFGDSVQKIPAYAFYVNSSSYRPNIVSVTIGNSVTSIGDYAFRDCSGLTSITIPDSVTSIGSGAFRGCSGLTSITIPDSVTSIGSSAFRGCSGLTSVTIGNSVTSIRRYAFFGCSGLTSITIPDSVTSIGSSAFSGCSGLTSVTIGNSVTSIGSAAFEDCSGLTSVTIGNGVTSIGSSAFSGCSGLTSITIPDSVTSIGSAAFEDCSGLTSITISDSVTSIGERAFYNCSDLTSIYYTGDMASWLGKTWQSNVMASGRTLYIEGSKVEGAITIPDGVSSIPSYAFAYQKAITSVLLPEKLNEIGAYAFYGCSGIELVILPSNIEKMGAYVFGNVSAQIRINYETIPAGWDSTWSGNCTVVQSVSDDNFTYSFNNEGGLTVNAYIGNDSNVIIPSEVNGVPVTQIGSGAFTGANRHDIKSVSIPDSVTIIGAMAFFDCSGLTSVVIPDSVTDIGAYAFMLCPKLSTVTLGSNVAQIGIFAFYYCHNLVEVYNRSTLSVDKGEFAYAKNIYTTEDGTRLSVEDGFVFYYDGTQAYLVGYNGEETELVLPAGFTAFNGTYVENYIINPYTFYGGGMYSALASSMGINIEDFDPTNSTLQSVYIPGNIIEIGEYAFYNNKALTSLAISSGVKCIGQYAFYGCSGLTSIVIPDTVTSIGKSAFVGTAWYNYQPDGLVYAGKVAYKYNGTMPSNTSIVLKEGTLGIAGSAFEGCSGLTSITIPDSVTSIGGYAFEGCSGLTSITIPDSVTSIGSCAFDGCSGLTSIVIPDSVTSIGSYAFRGCTGLTSIIVEDGNPVYHSEENCLIETATNTLILGCKTSIIPDSVTSIGSYAFDGCSGLTSIVIPDSVTSIGSYAFRGCTGLTSITIPDSVTSIGSYAFDGCSGLTSIVIPDSVTSIGSYAFRGCTGLTSITIPDSVTSIGSYAFYGCTGLTSATFENTSGWEVSISSSFSSYTDLSSDDLFNPSIAANYLKSTYYNYYWRRV